MRGTRGRRDSPLKCLPLPLLLAGGGGEGHTGAWDSPLKCLPLPLLLAGGGGEGHTGAVGLTLEVPPLALAARVRVRLAERRVALALPAL